MISLSDFYKKFLIRRTSLSLSVINYFYFFNVLTTLIRPTLSSHSNFSLRIENLISSQSSNTFLTLRHKSSNFFYLISSAFSSYLNYDSLPYLLNKTKLCFFNLSTNCDF